VNRANDPEETAALAVLAELGRIPGSDDTRVISGEDEVEDVLRRLDLEAMGLLAFGVEPAQAPPELRQGLLDRIAADETQEVAPVDAEVAGKPAATAAPAPAAAPAAAASREPRPRSPALSGGGAARRRRSFAPALAALFALAAVGVGFAAFWLASELSSAQVRLARLESEVRRLEAAAKAERESLSAALAELERQRDFVTARAALVFDLRPPGTSPQPAARGRLWVAADHQHWQLDVAGLAPTPAGREYQIWFLVDGQPNSGGSFAVTAGRGARFDVRMPAGTSGVAITLERAGGVAAPTTPRLLLGEAPVDL